MTIIKSEAAHSSTPERAVFFTTLLLALLPLWLAGEYFVTGDGPCHSYNASVLLDWFTGKQADFYGQFYTINPYFEPNWWTHAWLMLLQTVFSPAVAEKVFLSLYVLSFGFGIRFLIGQIRPNSKYLSTVGLLFCWHHLLQMGFFNYSWSLVGMFWLVGYWLSVQSNFGIKHGLVMSITWVAVYAMHPIGLAFAGLAIGLSILAETSVVLQHQGIKSACRTFLHKGMACFFTAVPALLLTMNYLMRKEIHQGSNTESFSGILDALATLTMLITMNSSEHPLVNLVVLLLLVTLIMAIISRVQTRKWLLHDFWLLFFIVSLLIYFTQAGTNSLELLMPLRLQLLPWFGLLFWVATAELAAKWRLVVSILSFGILLALVIDRLPTYRAASRLVQDWTAVSPHIKERSVLMVVNYNFNGRDENGNQIADRIWMFNHAADYIGAEHSGIIMSDNYEALMKYFPLIWREEADLYKNTTYKGLGFESRPPSVDLLGYTERSNGRKINYVLILDQTEADRQDERGRLLMDQIATAYELVTSTREGTVVLYRLRE